MKTFPYHTPSREIFRNSPETGMSIIGFSGQRIGTFSRRDSGIKGSGVENMNELLDYNTVQL